MAGRKSGSDIHNGPVSYLDDVPFKVNEKFRCPAKVGLPIGFCLPDCQSLLSEMQYDFSLEQSSVRWGDDLAKVRAAKAQEDELQRADLEKDGQSASQDNDAGLAGGKKARPAEEQDLLPPAMNPVLAGLRHNAILTPLPAPSFGPAQPTSSNPVPQSFNLADFEREEDPFDKLELKTLNDKEELRNILQSQPQSSVPAPDNSTDMTGSTVHAPAETEVLHNPNGLVGPVEQPAVGGVGTSKGQMETDRPCNIRSLTFPKLSDPGDSPSEPPHSVYPATTQCSVPNGTPPSLLRASPQTNSTVLLESAQNSTPKQSNSVTAAGTPANTAPVNAALHKLSPSERQCVDTIVSMGYPYEGVLKAMQRQGQNVEQVLEYMFIHTRLCERGFDVIAVEECLEMYQCSEEKALQFLQLMSRFGEMGFDRDAIKEVLLLHNNDQDKALEDLMARAAAS